MNEKNTKKEPETTEKAIREAIIQSTAAAFKDPAVQARFQEWMTTKNRTGLGGDSGATQGKDSKLSFSNYSKVEDLRK